MNRRASILGMFAAIDLTVVLQREPSDVPRIESAESSLSEAGTLFERALTISGLSCERRCFLHEYRTSGVIPEPFDYQGCRLESPSQLQDRRSRIGPTGSAITASNGIRAWAADVIRVLSESE